MSRIHALGSTETALAAVKPVMLGCGETVFPAGLAFVPVVVAAAQLKPDAYTLLFVLSVLKVGQYTLTLYLLPPKLR